MPTSSVDPKRGDIWRVELDPTRGVEMQKTRPAVVVNAEGVGKLPLRVIVPLTGWQEAFASLSWMTKVEPEAETGLSKESAADAFQIRSVDIARFRDRTGTVPEETLERIVAAVALIVDYAP